MSDDPAPDRKTVNVKGIGDFTFKRPNIGDTIEIGRRQAVALRGTSPKDVDDMTAGMAYVVAALGVCVVDGPDSLMVGKGDAREFTPTGLYDQKVLLSIYDPFREWIDTFRGDGEDTGTKKTSKAGK